MSCPDNTTWVNIRWRVLPPGWVKINTDGASKGNPGDAGCGGVIPGDDGGWLVGFMHHIGCCSALVAEL